MAFPAIALRSHDCALEYPGLKGVRVGDGDCLRSCLRGEFRR